MLEATRDRISDTIDRSVDLTREHPWLATSLGVSALLGGYLLLPGKGDYRKKPDTRSLTGGGIDRGKVKSKYDNYYDAYGKEAGSGITDRSRTTELVDTFYNLVTDVYEWGWGQSFHFSPLLPGKNWSESEAAHESRLPGLLGLKSGMKALDVGCGVGGPMRTIASTSGAEVTGITINEYQVKRGKYHNGKLKVDGLCKPVQGDFLNMPFPDNTFDGAYAIEATCHAPVLKDVYAEIMRVLKPGAKFCSYEWVSTAKYDANNPEHVRIIDEINYGNGLPEMRSYKQAEQAGKDAGLTLIKSYDIATDSCVAGPWYSKLVWLKKANIIAFNSALVRLFTFLRIAPAGIQDVHDMLVNVAQSLTAGGETELAQELLLTEVQACKASRRRDMSASVVIAMTYVAVFWVNEALWAMFDFLTRAPAVLLFSFFSGVSVAFID